jgi:hypothetical protein
MRLKTFLASLIVLAVALPEARGQGTLGGVGNGSYVGPTPLESIRKTITDFLGKHSDRLPSDSGGQLVIDLSTLSGLELSLAITIEQLGQSPGPSYMKVFVLNQLLDKVKDNTRSFRTTSLR